VTALAVVPLFGNLGAGVLWSDEADTAVYALSILQSGLPHAWDGRTFLDSCDAGSRVTSGLVMVSHPWLAYYVTAASFAVFGDSVWVARFPFALAGLVTIPGLYLLVYRVTGDRRASLIAAIVLLLSVQFLLYSRQCRHYALNTLLTLMVILLFLRMGAPPFGPRLNKINIKGVVPFVIACILLFHAHPLPAVATLAALAGLTLFRPSFRPQRRPFWFSLPVTVLYIGVWSWFSQPGWAPSSTPLAGLADFGGRLAQFVIECNTFLPFLGWAALLLLVHRRLTAGDRDFLVLTAALWGAFGLFLSLSQRRSEMWVVGARYFCAMLPLASAVTAVLITRAASSSMAAQDRGRAPRRLAVAGLIALFCVTHLPGTTVVSVLLRQPNESPIEGIAWHPARNPEAMFLRMELLGFAHELLEYSPGTVTRLCEFLNEHASPDDLLVTNFDWQPLYFHTRLRQALGILPDYPIYTSALERNLPRYVFSLQPADWIIWRWPWDGYMGYYWDDIQREIKRLNMTVRAAATFPETHWENRPDLHFRRFPRMGQVYQSVRWQTEQAAVPDAVVYRVVR
jgi:hypothetical protein